jgi:hypothetical protein
MRVVCRAEIYFWSGWFLLTSTSGRCGAIQFIASDFYLSARFSFTSIRHNIYMAVCLGGRISCGVYSVGSNRLFVKIAERFVVVA